MQIGFGQLRIDCAQDVIAAQRDDQGIGVWRQDPIHPRQSTGGCVAGHACVDQRGIRPIGGQPALHLWHKACVLRQAIALHQAVAQRDDCDLFGHGRRW